MKQAVIQQITDTKIIAIVRGIYGEDALKLAEALSRGGISLMEITFDQADQSLQDKTADTIRLLCDKMGGRMCFGAGTVTSVHLVRKARKAGARFVISPDVNGRVIRAARRCGLVSIPGAMTPTEIMKAHRCGADFVKVFPAGNLGPDYLKAIRQPINHIRLLAVGGINEDNAVEFLAAGACGLGIGGLLANRKLIHENRLDEITEIAKRITAAIG